MSIYNPITLEELAVQSLLRNEASTISALEYLPINLFPPVFKEAFIGRHMELLKAMVAAWPFSYLPVGALMKTPDVELLQAVLDGVDILQTQEVHPSWRLGILDLRNMNQDFWDVWAGRDWNCSTETESNEQVCNELRQDLKVVTELSLSSHLKEHQACLLHWAQQRKDCVQLCCVKMKICDSPIEIIKEVLDIFPPENIEELELYTNQVQPFLGRIAPHLGSLVYHGGVTVIVDLIVMDSSQYPSVDICLKSPLETLIITLCHLSQSDVKQLSQCQGLCQLRHLNFSYVVLSSLGVPHLRVLLENTADTLQTLELVGCWMEDSHLSALLPALSLCSHLTTVNFCDNKFSTAVLKKLLQSVANLSNMTAEFYPAPLECYDPPGSVLVEKFAQLCPELLDILCAKRQPKTILFATDVCLECCTRCFYDTEARFCQCWQ
ncbi:PRAME family member 6-like [Mesocricetus auratus]|uniref:PRAME family member 6-like n=1 Tax=Mesocricetus auratus TaxID=10036 RepID=A0ABM2X272_MESAU|nr:PRAME family member 6-like [Mesocricetus auratus]